MPTKEQHHQHQQAAAGDNDNSKEAEDDIDAPILLDAKAAAAAAPEADETSQYLSSLAASADGDGHSFAAASFAALAERARKAAAAASSAAGSGGGIAGSGTAGVPGQAKTDEATKKKLAEAKSFLAKAARYEKEAGAGTGTGAIPGIATTVEGSRPFETDELLPEELAFRGPIVSDASSDDSDSDDSNSNSNEGDQESIGSEYDPLPDPEPFVPLPPLRDTDLTDLDPDFVRILTTLGEQEEEELAEAFEQGVGLGGQEGDDDDYDDYNDNDQRGSSTDNNDNDNIDLIGGEYRDPHGDRDIDEDLSEEDEDELEDIGIFDYGVDDPVYKELLNPEALAHVFDDTDPVVAPVGGDGGLEEDPSGSGDTNTGDIAGASTSGGGGQGQGIEELDFNSLSLGKKEEEGEDEKEENKEKEEEPPIIPLCMPCSPDQDQLADYLDLQQEQQEGAATESVFALSAEEEEQERLESERRKALLQLSAVGRRKLGQISEEEDDDGLEAGEEKQAEEGKEEDGLPRISRLAYDLDSSDFDLESITEVPDVDADDEFLLSDIERQIPGLKAPQDFEANFEAAVLEHMMSEGGAAGAGSMGEGVDLAALPPTHDANEEAPANAADTSDVPMEQKPEHPERKEQEVDHNPTSARASKSMVAFNASMPFVESFGMGMEVGVETPKNERSCIGHKGKIFGMAFSPCGSYLATASEDSTVMIWDVEKHRCLDTLKGHNKDNECLRVAWASSTWGGSCLDRKAGDAGGKDMILATAGADGVVRVWRKHDASAPWKCFVVKDHSADSPSNGNDMEEEGGEKDLPQIYALQFIDQWQHPVSPSSASMDIDASSSDVLLTSCDDCVYLWRMAETKSKEQGTDPELELSEVMTMRFSHMEHANGGVSFRIDGKWFEASEHAGEDSAAGKAFGGGRNPDNLVYVFDASYNENSGLLGVALADGTLRLVNPRGVCLSVLSLPGCESHLTSFSWDSTGSRLASCVATGHVILWHVDTGDGKGQIQVNCTSVLCGGHDMGRPTFGAKYLGGNDENLLISWGVDGKLCLWDSRSQGEIFRPIATLVAKNDYPIYAVDVSEHVEEPLIGRVAVGGGSDGGFLGIPAFIYDVTERQDTFGMVKEKPKKQRPRKSPNFKEPGLGKYR